MVLATVITIINYDCKTFIVQSIAYNTATSAINLGSSYSSAGKWEKIKRSSYSWAQANLKKNTVVATKGDEHSSLLGYMLIVQVLVQMVQRHLIEAHLVEVGLANDFWQKWIGVCTTLDQNGDSCNISSKVRHFIIKGMTLHQRYDIS